MSLILEKLTARTEELWEKRYRQEIDLFPIAAQEVSCNPDKAVLGYPGRLAGHQQMEKGAFFIGRDRYLHLQANVIVPEKKEGSQVIGVFDFGKTGDGFNSGFESLLYINGKPHQGVDTHHNEVVLDDFAGREIELTFLLWTGLEGGGPKTEQVHRFSKAGVGYLDKATDLLYYDADAIVKSLPLMPETIAGGQQLLEALDEAFDLLDWDPDCLYASVALAQAYLENRLSGMPKHNDVTVHCVGHTHIDVAWLWRLKHTREKAVRSFSTVLRLMEQNNDYLFLQSQPQLYQYIKQDSPETYAQIKQRIAKGQWEPDGGMWLEADCNITSGEALVRQFLHGCHFIKDEFGHDCTFLWLPDVFGYSWALPQILKQCGIKTFATSKISWNDTNRMPHDLFRWRGIDGSEVLTYFITTPYAPNSNMFKFGATYNGTLAPYEVVGSWENFQDKDMTRDVMIPYGYGDGGGGPTAGMLKTRRAMNKLPILPHVVNSTAGNYFKKIHRDMEQKSTRQPVWDGELYLEYHRGTYTSQARNKKWNRKLELKLAEAEWLASCAMAQGEHYPQQALHDAWEVVLRNQFHDIIPGSSIHEVYEDSEIEYTAANDLLKKTRAAVLQQLTATSKTHWTLWNPASIGREDLAFVPETRAGRFQEADGSHIPASRAEGGYRLRLPLKGLEMRSICFVPGEEPASAPAVGSVGSGTVSTPLYTIRWSPEGWLASIYDKENERELLKGQGNCLEIFEDKPLRFDAWDIDHFYTQKRETAAVQTAPRLVENNGVRVVIRFTYSYRKSTITQDLVLYAHSRRIDFETEVDWHEKNRLLKAAFDFDIKTTKASYDIQFGYVERPTHSNTSWDTARFEVVGHKWADISDSGYGVSLLNDCKYGYSALKNTLKISLLKSAIFPDTEADMGKHTFTYSLFPHLGAVAQGGTISESHRLNQPIGAVPGEFSGKQLLQVNNPAILVDAVKKAEKENCLIVRLHEATGSRQHALLAFGYPVKQWETCNLLEQGDGAPSTESITITLQPFEIRTLKIWLA